MKIKYEISQDESIDLMGMCDTVAWWKQAKVDEWIQLETKVKMKITKLLVTLSKQLYCHRNLLGLCTVSYIKLNSKRNIQNIQKNIHNQHNNVITGNVLKNGENAQAVYCLFAYNKHQKKKIQYHHKHYWKGATNVENA